MKKENRLILDLLRYHADNKNKDRLNELLKGKLDWNYILEFSRKQGVSPILYKTLKNLNFRKKILREFEKDYWWVYNKNLVKYRELNQIVRECDKEKIEVILLKGMHLAKYVYKDEGLRPFGDVDLLVKRKDILKIEGIFKKKGCPPPSYDYNGAKEYHHTKKEVGEYLYYNKKNKFWIEVKYNVLESNYDNRSTTIDLVNFWKNKIKLKDYGGYVLQDEDLLIYMLLHILDHEMLVGLRHIFDIIEIINTYKIDWRYIYQNHNKYQDKIYYALNWVNLFFPGAIENEAIEMFKPQVMNKLLFDCMKKEIYTKYNSMKSRVDYESAWPYRMLLRYILKKKVKYRFIKFALLLCAVEYNKKGKLFYVSQNLVNNKLINSYYQKLVNN